MEKEGLKKTIESKAFVRNTDQSIDILTTPDAWLFDFRKIVLHTKDVNQIADIFYNTYKNKGVFQIGTLEVTGIPLMTAIILKFYEKENRELNAFFIRKSRKKTGLTQMIEGAVRKNEKIVLVDDILNSGNSFWRQIEVLEDLGHSVDTVWSILRYRNIAYYVRFTERNINIDSLFTLNDFTDSLGIQNISEQPDTTRAPFKALWKFKSSDPSYAYVLGKSQPILDEKRIYFGADNQTFWALDQESGAILWQFKVGHSAQKKSIFSNPALFKDLVVFGAYDGNIYALERESGHPRWICSEADWVGSSPAVAEDLGLIFIGLEFGLFKRHGGIVALNGETGKKVWADYSHPAYTHSSPHYISDHRQVIIGSNDGRARLYNAETGEKEWEFITRGGEGFDITIDQGFGSGDIKESFVYDKKHDLIVFGTMDGNLYVLKRETGECVHRFECESGVWATPLLYKSCVYFTSTDKYLRCIDLNSFDLKFEKNLDGTRIFSSPVIHNNKLYVGTNAGRLHEIDPETGIVLGYFQTIERITNTLTYNQKTNRYFLPTQANEIICLKRVE